MYVLCKEMYNFIFKFNSSFIFSDFVALTASMFHLLKLVGLEFTVRASCRVQLELVAAGWRFGVVVRFSPASLNRVPALICWGKRLPDQFPKVWRCFVYSWCKQNQRFFGWFHFCSIKISIEQLSVYIIIFLISRCKKIRHLFSSWSALYILSS